MRTEAHALAPAKINLHLEVGDCRPDGFHDLVSLFQAVDLYDALVVRRAGGEGDLRLDGEFGFPTEKNIVTRAVELFRAETGRTDGLAILVEKRIPMGAGFGGGSSDAAAALRCLRALLAPDLTAPRMEAMAGALGSDVPFFLGSAAALVEGRGERVTTLRPRTDFAVAAVIPSAVIGTAAAYAALDAGAPRAAIAPGAAAAVAARYEVRPAREWGFLNSFDAVGMAVTEVAAARDALLAAGAAAVRLTGSGSALIAVFDGPETAGACVERVNASGRRALLLRPLATIPRVW